MFWNIVIGLFLLALVIRFFRWVFSPDEVIVTRTYHTHDFGGMDYDDEDEVTIVGGLKREVDNGQMFVIDPVDKTKNWLNSNDDMYEDAAGKVWRLV